MIIFRTFIYFISGKFIANTFASNFTTSKSWTAKKKTSRNRRAEIRTSKSRRERLPGSSWSKLSKTFLKIRNSKRNCWRSFTTFRSQKFERKWSTTISRFEEKERQLGILWPGSSCSTKCRTMVEIWSTRLSSVAKSMKGLLRKSRRAKCSTNIWQLCSNWADRWRRTRPRRPSWRSKFWKHFRWPKSSTHWTKTIDRFTRKLSNKMKETLQAIELFFNRMSITSFRNKIIFIDFVDFVVLSIKTFLISVAVDRKPNLLIWTGFQI